MGVLDGKVSIVTGGTSGIGKRIVEGFIKEGSKVVVAARRTALGEELEERLGIIFVPTDVSIEADIQRMINQTLEKFGRIDTLINNAGIPSPLRGIESLPTIDFDQIMTVNFRSVFLGIKYVSGIMASQGCGSIINISSIAALHGAASGHDYTAAKGAVLALTRSAAAELGEKGIRVNSISPGFIITGIFGKGGGLDDEKAEQVGSALTELFSTLQPILRAGLPDDIAHACVYLSSDAATFVNGHDLVIDGGLSSVWNGWSKRLSLDAEIQSRIQASLSGL